jgi:hypothetical protein
LPTPLWHRDGGGGVAAAMLLMPSQHRGGVSNAITAEFLWLSWYHRHHCSIVMVVVVLQVPS